MSIPAPHLDDRRFQDLVDEAKRRVQQRCPEWTDHNVSDPGVTLIETFAFMVEQLIYRLNRVPERHYRKFLELMGLRMFPPLAAKVPVTFWLSAAQDRPVVVPGEAQVATVGTDAVAPVVFTTEDDLTIPPATLTAAMTSTGIHPPVDRFDDLLTAGTSFPCFSDPPQPGDAIYFGLSTPVPNCAVLLRMRCETAGAGVDPDDPPLRWEAGDGRQWRRCEVEKDTTGGFNRPGDVVVHVPPEHARGVLAGTTAGWLRCVVATRRPDQPGYADPPRLDALAVSTIGGTTGATHADFVHDEVIGTSNGVPGQRFTLQRGPLVDTRDPLTVAVVGRWSREEWTEVDSFAGSGPDDRHVRVDRVAGQIVFGPAVRTEHGALERHGAVPEPGATLRVPVYRVGGGRAGNVESRTVTVLRDPVPFVASVSNRTRARGGRDGETVENAVERGPLLLRTRDRAVTHEDYKQLAAEAAGGDARVLCVPVGASPTGDDRDVADGVRVLLVPDQPPRKLTVATLQPPTEMLERVAAHLDRRRCLGARVVVEPPFYQGVTVVARLQARAGVDPDRVAEQALEWLDEWVNPLVGGPRRTGWRLGRAVSQGDLHALLQRVSGVDLVDDLKLFPADPLTGRRGAESHRIELPANGLAISYNHQVRVVDAARRR